MKVPKSIQEKMHKVAELSVKLAMIMNDVDDYFESKGIPDEVRRSGNGISLEELEYGNDITDQFVEWAERDFDGLI